MVTRISDAEEESLAKLRGLPAGAIRRGHRSLTFGPYCGVIQTPLLAIEILPKIGCETGSSDRARELLVGLLQRAGELGIRRVGEADLSRQRRHLLDVFIEDFCGRVKDELRRGAIERYTERTENLNAIRGRLQLTDHLRINAFDHSRLYCRFDERSVDNPYNRVLKGVLRKLFGLALSPRTRAMVAAFLHRFDEVGDQRVTVRDVDALHFGRTIQHWQPVFERARLLLEGLFPDVRTGDNTGSALLFNMEQLFETVLGRRVRQVCHAQSGTRLLVQMQGPTQSLATQSLARQGFQLRPDITIRSGRASRYGRTIRGGNEYLAILDAKWKLLKLGESNSGVSTGDAYQMNAYASRYRCKRLALVYPASTDCLPGKRAEFALQTEVAPSLQVVAVDVRDLAFGTGIPRGLENLLSTDGLLGRETVSARAS